MTLSENRPQISASQLFCVLMASRLSAEVVFTRTASQTASESVPALIIAELVRFVAALPVIIYSANHANLYKSISGKSRALGWIAAVIAAVLFTYASVKTLIELSLFTRHHLFMDGSIRLLFILGAAFAAYAASKGAEGLARSGAIFLIAAAAMTLVVMFSVTPYIKSASFESLNASGETPRLTADFLERLTRGGEYLVFAVMLPYVSKKTSGSAWRSAAAFSGIGTAAAALMCLMNCLVLREMYAQCEHPLIAAASLADVSLLKRVDGFAAAVWGLCGAFRAAVMLWAACSVLAEVRNAGTVSERSAAE